MPSDLEQSIFKVLAYHAYNSFPITSSEIWKWCDSSESSLNLIDETLTSSEWLRSNGMRVSDGFYGLGPIDDWKNNRINRVTDALRKSRRATNFIKFASILPWVKMVAICNSLAYSFTNHQSDIDLFIVTKRGRIWSTRLILTGVLSVLRLRPGEGKRDPICLSFFVTEDALDLSSLKIGANDPYLTMWLSTLTPVIDCNDILAKLHATNRWIRPSLPRSQPIDRASAYCVKHHLSLPDISFLERFAERFQRSHFPQTIRSMMNLDSRVVVTDSMLKFHENDRRQMILDAFNERCTVTSL